MSREATVGRSNSPEVSVIPVPLRRVAAVAECLKVADLVPASLDARRYVIHFQRTFVSRDAAKFAAELGVLEDFITQGPTDVASGSPTVFPDSLTALGDVISNLPVANGLQFLHLLCGKLLYPNNS